VGEVASVYIVQYIDILEPYYSAPDAGKYNSSQDISKMYIRFSGPTG